jgi:FkbM family methyltransferase
MTEPAMVDGGARPRVRFRYAAPWHADEARRGPLDIDLAVVDAEDIVARDIREAGAFYEVELLEHLGTRGPLGGVYIDVGANVGNHAVFFGRFLADHVVAVEPHPALVRILERNLEANGVREYSLLACAVGAQPGLAGLWQPPAPGINHPRTQVRELAAPGRGELLVPVVPLDDLLDRLAPRLAGRPVTCMKIDVEGMELAVLRGARRLLDTHRPQLVVELVGEEARRDVGEFLGALGYRHTGRRFCWAPTYHFIDPGRHRLRASDHRPTPDPAADRVRAMTDDLCAVIPPGAAFVLVDEEVMWAGLVMDGRRRFPFPERDGQYWGPPPDDATAIDELERLRRLGARYLAVTANAFWWLAHYEAFARHLRTRYRSRLANERVVVFELVPSPAPAGP